MKSSFDHPEKSPGYILWRLTTEWQKRQRKALAPLKLTHVQFVYLACLQWLEAHHDEPVTQIKLSELSGLDKMVVSEITQKLINKKYINRNKNMSDGRSYIVNLTKKGRQIVDLAIPLVEGIDKSFFIEQKSLLASLKKNAGSLG